VACSVVGLLVTCALSLQAQAAPVRSFTLEGAVNYALANYPAVAAVLEQVKAAQSGVALARANYLPQFNAVYQASRATQNQVDGVFLPSSIAPAVEGPVQAYSGDSFWGTQAGALLSWEPADFGLRHSQVEAAQSRERKSEADVGVARLQVASAAGNYFFNVIASQQAVVAAQANVKRWEVFAQTVQTLVQNQLRPGADASRAEAELAKARTQLYLAQGAEQQAEAVLASLLGVAGTSVQTELGGLSTLPAVDSFPASPAAASPLALDQQALVEEAHADERVLGREDYPRLFLQAEVFGRGSGVSPVGADTGGPSGLGFATANWLAGITVLFPNLFDFGALGNEKRIAKANEIAQRARYNQALQDLNGQIAAAQASLRAARLVAGNTPIEIEAARQSETQARARYQSALTNLVEVAEAENLLAQAETDDAVARINVWRGLFSVAVAQGNLQPLWDLLHAAEGKP
jgi:outer membrane protein